MEQQYQTQLHLDDPGFEPSRQPGSLCLSSAENQCPVRKFRRPDRPAETKSCIFVKSLFPSCLLLYYEKVRLYTNHHLFPRACERLTKEVSCIGSPTGVLPSNHLENPGNVCHRRGLNLPGHQERL